MKKPPDILDNTWFDTEFAKSIKFPSNKETKFIIKNCINSEKYLLNNDFNKFNNVETKQAKNQVYIKSEKILLRFTSIQRIKLFKWFRSCDKVYNFCVKDFNQNKKIWLKETHNNYKSYKLYVFGDLYKTNLKGAPYDVLTDEVRAFCSNIKSCETKLHNKMISSYIISKRKANRKFKSIMIPKKAINNKGIFVGLLGKNNDLSKYLKNKNISDSRLIYNLPTNTFYLNLITKNCDIKNTDKKSFISLDPGENIFCSYFASDSYGYFGKELYKVYIEKRNKISKLQHILAKYGIRNKAKIKKRMINIYNKIKNITKEFHNKLALYLCRNYKIILLPEFKTQCMVKTQRREIKKVIKEIRDTENNGVKKEILVEKLKQLNILNKKNRLSSKIKYTLNTMSHYKFKQHLINKANEYGCLLNIVTEEYTSMKCSKCGTDSKVYKNRVKECVKCKYEINRDINGSINIFHKNRNLVIKRRKACRVI